MTIKEYKQFYKLTNKQVAEKIGISLVLYYHILNGTRKPSRRVLMLMKENTPEIDINIFLK